MTVRKAVQGLVKDGILVQRQGSGTYVAPRVERLEQSLTQLTSFTEEMIALGKTPRSTWLDRGVYTPTSEEKMALGLSSDEMVTRLSRLRIADDMPLIISHSILSSRVVPDPHAIDSLYAALERTGNRPTRALHHFSAINVGEEDAPPAGTADRSGGACRRTHLVSRQRQDHRAHAIHLSRRCIRFRRGKQGERMTRQALVADTIFDGTEWHSGSALLIDGDAIAASRPRATCRADAIRVDAGSMLAPGFIDLQVNGGDGVMFNDAPNVETIARVCRAHGRLGTTALLATFVTDRPEVSERMVAAGVAAADRGVPGFLGLHLEGPHLSVARKGAHDQRLIRPLDAAALAFLTDAGSKLPHLLVTLAPESADQAAVRAWSRRASSSASATPMRRTRRANDYAAAGRDDGDAPVQRDEPARQPCAGARRRRPRKQCAICRPDRGRRARASGDDRDRAPRQAGRRAAVFGQRRRGDGGLRHHFVHARRPEGDARQRGD